MWAINGAAAVAGGIVAVLALRVAGSTDALFLAAGLYLATALVAPRRAAALEAAGARVTMAEIP